MHRLFRKIPLMAKLLLLALLPILFGFFVTLQLLREESSNVRQMGAQLKAIRQTATISRLIDQLQLERRTSADQLQAPTPESLAAERARTDSLLARLDALHDMTLDSFRRYAFLAPLDTVRRYIDAGRYPADQIMHFYSSAVFRFGTLNHLPTLEGDSAAGLYHSLMTQQLLGELIVYQSIISANIANLLFTRRYQLETLLGTLPSYDIYKTYLTELRVKALPPALAEYRSLQTGTPLGAVQRYFDSAFKLFRVDTTVSYYQWRQQARVSLDALRAMQMKYLGFAESRVQQAYDAQLQRRTITLALLLLFILLLFLSTAVVLKSINTTLKNLQRAAGELARGKLDLPIQVETRDAMGRLALSMREIDTKQKAVTVAARQIGEGDFEAPFEPRSGEDMLGNAILMMRESLQVYTRALRQSREEFETLADFMPGIVWTADAAGRVTYVNRRWKEVTGIDKDAGEPSWVQVLHPQDVGPTLYTWHRSLESGEPYQLEHRYRLAATGEYRWFLGSVLPLKNEAGEVIKWIGTATDIHDQKLQHEQLEKLVFQRTLELNRSNEDLQQFAHVASHDLKEPLRKIRMFSHRLENEFGESLPEKGKAYLGKLQQSSERMTNLIESILNYSVVNATENSYELVDLNLLLEGVENDLELLILQKEARLEYRQLPGLYGSPTLLQQLFYNLVNNALKFSRADARPVIRIEVREVDPRANPLFEELEKDMAYTHIAVSDNGIGFKQAYAERIFHVFSRLNTRESYDGTGLGLALCRKIVHRHRGIIYAEGKEGEGATFHIVLPREHKPGR